jgi:hypothetical protein
MADHKPRIRGEIARSTLKANPVPFSEFARNSPDFLGNSFAIVRLSHGFLTGSTKARLLIVVSGLRGRSYFNWAAPFGNSARKERR